MRTRGAAGVCVLLALLAGCASAPRREGAAVSGGSPEDYARLGLSRTHVEPWEDGMRTGGESGTYEWWYFDFTVDDGSTIVIVFYTKSITSPETGLEPMVSFKMDGPGGATLSKAAVVKPAEFAAARDRCQVRVGASTVTGDLTDYTLHVEVEDVVADLKLHGSVPSWRPGTGYSFFRGEKEHFFAWLPSVPQGSMEGRLTVAGKARLLSGVGYHDHNWGDAPMMGLIHDWYWGRAQVGDYSVIASYITASEAYGGETIPIFMLARGGKIIADDSTRVRFRLEDVTTDRLTGKPVGNLVIYDYDGGQVRFRVTFRREADIARSRFVDLLPWPQGFLAALSGFDGAYLRFTGPATVERFDGEKSVETVHQRAAVWELMYFGHAPRR
jgi:hypothetical protein